MNKVTFKKAANGEFQVLKNGVVTEFSIHNGSHGCSGVNEYAIYNSKTLKVTKVGTLASAKKMVQLAIA